MLAGSVVSPAKPMSEAIAIILICPIATLISATFGFGAALVAMPLLTIAVGLQTAIPLFGLMAATITLIIASLSWRQMQWSSVWRLVTASCLGIPIGLLGVRFIPEAIVLRGVGTVLISFGLFRLVQLPLPRLKHPNWAFGFGFLAGVLGGAYNTAGPPVLIYGSACQWSPQKFRATLQGYFCPTAIGIMISHGLSGLWTMAIAQLYFMALPGALGGLVLGNWIHQRLPQRSFQTLVSALVISLGSLLWLRS